MLNAARALLAVGCLLLCPVQAESGIPTVMNYQGILKTGDTTVSAGVTTMRFRIYDASIAGAVLWESSDGDDEYVDVVVQDGGLFSYLLGSDNPLPAALVNYDSLWLGVRRGSDDVEMVPRTQLASVSYSFRSLAADTAAYSRLASLADSAGWAMDAESASHSKTSGYADTANHASFALIAETALFVQTRFPAPAWQSGWIALAPGGVENLTHSLGGNPLNYLVDLQFKHAQGQGIHNSGIGGDVVEEGGSPVYLGAFYQNLSANGITIRRREHDPVIDSIRVRIWITE